MPLYEYICSNCGTEFEKLVRFSDAHIHTPECPHCASTNTSKRLSLFASYATSGTSGTASTGGSQCGSSSGGFT